MNAKLKKVLALSFIFLMLALTYLPILVLVIYSFTTTRVIGGAWAGFSFDLYIKLFQDEEIMTAVGNSLLIGLTSSVLATAIGTFTAVGMFYLKKVPKAYMNVLTQLTMVNAEIVTGIAFMLFFLLIQFIPNGYATLIIAHTMITTPYVIMSVAPRLTQLNPNLYEAGLDLGASPMRTMFKVILPQLIPGMIAGFALAFTLSLDDFIVTKFVNGSVSTISTYLYFKLKKGIMPVLRALSALIFVVVLTILLAINLKARKKTA